MNKFFSKIIFSVFQISILIPIHINITLKQVFYQNIWNKLISSQHTSYKLKPNQVKYKNIKIKKYKGIQKKLS